MTAMLSSSHTRWSAALLGACLSWPANGIAAPEPPAVTSAVTLRAAYVALQAALAHNAFNLPLNLDSHEVPHGVSGDIHAIVAYPFATMCVALRGAPQWCDILLLHLNVKYCHASEDKLGSHLTVYIGRKHEQALDDAYPVEFLYQVAAETPAYRHIVLVADKGPVGTRDYRIMLEAMPLEGDRTFIHLSYSYSYGFTAKMATQAYFDTVGSAKVGFTVLSRKSDGQPVYVDDMRAALERNTMRYFLAIEAYMDGLSVPPAERFERRLRTWFASTERYPLQLHEESETDYLTMKRHEYRRQQAAIQ
jgi:hypothetical protein